MTWTVPSIIEVVLSVVLIGPLVALFSVTPVYANHTPAYMILITVPILLLLPVEIIKNRVITTPYKFTAFQPSIALQVLLSPAERAHPLRLYLLPGVAVAAIVPVFFIVGASLLWRFITLKLVFHHGLKLWSWTWSHTVYRFFSVVLLVLTSALVTPLRVMTIRLSLQCLQREEPNDPEQQSGHHHDNSQAVYTSEEVVEIRAGLPPYTSAKDCAKRIMEEEGKQALFRGWWITALGLAPMFLST
ncbi:hypothetical protein MIND_00617000 [Mycena indigotica]|uniref:Uncharacterized protein n=1 Tax=Mycena indigotica TaxID=2126181 RepID=A0A8H6SRU1_9AGAR|nr:uncharacterized protein MIND_00617000 [Mycena indigotica]KAF7303870.1 hypothetical protein MIND_00617000 [Mycena indigotica]